MESYFPPIRKATCSSTRNSILRQELVNIKRKHEIFIRKHRCESRKNVSSCDQLNVQYQIWGNWFSKRGYTVHNHISKREFAKLKSWFFANADIERTSQTVTIDFVHEALVETGLYSDTDVIKLFNMAGIDLNRKPLLDFQTVAKLLSPDNPVQLNIARQFISRLQSFKDDMSTERLGMDFVDDSGGVDSENIGETPRDQSQDSIGENDSAPQQPVRSLARTNSNTVSAARKVRNKVKRLRELSRASVGLPALSA